MQGNRRPFLGRQARRLAIAGCICTLAAMLLPAMATSARAEAPFAGRLKNSPEIKRVFRPVVDLAQRATVAVLVNDEQVALGATVTPDGYVLTKASELTGPVSCRLADGRTLNARVVGKHKDFDLAMLKIDARDLTVLQWNTGGEPTVGQWVASPGLEEIPVAIGVVSVPGRRIPPERGILGISINQTNAGPRITEVYPNSGADEAGLQVGDVITHVSGKEIADGSSLAAAIGKHRPGDMLHLRVRRGDEELAMRARLKYPFSRLLSRGALQNHLAGKLSTRRAGFPRAMQHDSVLTPQECGGPLVELNGKAVGINIARAGRAASYAIPASEILPLLDDFKSGRLAPGSIE